MLTSKQVLNIIKIKGGDQSMAKKPIKPKKKKKKVQYGPGFEGPPPLPSLHHLFFRKTIQD